VPPSLEFEQQRQSEQNQGKLERAEVHGRFLLGNGLFQVGLRI
jgi:hypothetical protein